jgi:putative DNA methylase
VLLKRINWAVVNRASRRQVRNRENHCPPVSLFRWWARRPHALVGALLEASRLPEGERVSDPFSGGGTVAIEAAVRGFRVYAQDLNPWATWGLATALDSVDPKSLERGSEAFLDALSPSAQEYTSACATHGVGEIAHVFWVRCCLCRDCGETVYLYPYSLVTVASRRRNEDSGYYGCSSCGAITRCSLETKRPSCRACGSKFSDDRQPLLANRMVQCPHCDAEIPYSVAWTQRPRWNAVLVQRACKGEPGPIRHFDWPTAADLGPQQRRREPLPASLGESIPLGLETRVLRQAGFRRWSDLYPPRQLRMLLRAAAIARELDVDEKVRSRLQLAVAGAGEMAGFLSRWDRFHPKAFEALANHRFSSIGLAVETNLLAKTGRGTIPRRLASSLKAARWIKEKMTGTAHLPVPTGATTKAIRQACDVAIVTGSSASQSLADASIKLVITDPPYYDAVQYNELSWLFLTWTKVVTGQTRRWIPRVRDEAVPNASRGTGARQYERLLQRIFAETARTLHPEGTLLLTYHSTDFRGWTALGRALHEAGLIVVALGVAHSENDKDHAKRHRLVFAKDLVIECRKQGATSKAPAVVITPYKSDHKELIAAGQAIARMGDADAKATAKTFLQATSRLRQKRIHVPQILQG